MTAQERRFILYDAGACGDSGTDDATVLEICTSATDAKSRKGEYGTMACYSYAVVDNELVNEQWEWDYYE